MNQLINSLEQTENTPEIPTFFKPTKQYSKMMLNCGYQTISYIYPDGILTIEHKTIKSGKYQSTIEIYHIHYCNIPIYIHDVGTSYFGKRYDRKLNRIVCHNKLSLLDGIKRIEIYENNSSEKMKQMNITCQTVQITTLNNAEHRFVQFSFLFEDFCVQYENDPYAGKQTLKELCEKLTNENAHIEIEK